MSCAEGCCVTDDSQTGKTPNTHTANLAASRPTKDFIQGQLHAFNLILTTFSHDYRNQDIQLVLQTVVKLKKEILQKENN